MAGSVKDQADKIAAMAKRPARENPFSVTEGTEAQEHTDTEAHEPTGTRAHGHTDTEAQGTAAKYRRVVVYLPPELAAHLDALELEAKSGGDLRRTRSAIVADALREVWGL